MERHINPFDSFDNCNTRSSPPGKVFWEIVRENDYFVLQVHKAENKPQLVGDLMKGLKSLWSHSYPYRIMLKSPKKLDNLEIAVAERYQEIESTWNWIEKELLDYYKTNTNLFSIFKEFFKQRKYKYWNMMYPKKEETQSSPSREINNQRDSNTPSSTSPRTISSPTLISFDIAPSSSASPRTTSSPVLISFDNNIPSSSPTSTSSKSPPKSSEEEDKDICKICFEKEIDCAIVKCGHAAICFTCGASLTKCPICREPIESLLKLYRA